MEPASVLLNTHFTNKDSSGNPLPSLSRVQKGERLGFYKKLKLGDPAIDLRP